MSFSSSVDAFRIPDEAFADAYDAVGDRRRSVLKKWISQLYLFWGRERALDRTRDPADKFAPRTIDLDLVVHDTTALDPDIVRYLHVARPLADLAPDLVHPVDGRTMAAIADALEASADPAFFPVPRPDVILSVRP